MASMNVLGRGLLGLACTVPLWVVGCGGTPSDSRPDATIADDTGTTVTPDAYLDPTIDAGPIQPNDTGTTGTSDTGGRVCRSPSGTCDLILQNCPTGQACVYALPNATATTPETVCAPVVGAGAAEGGACCALNSCANGLVCVGAMEETPGGGTCTAEGMGTCQRYCCGSSADCAAGELCNRFGSTFSGGICDTSDDCGLVDQTGCASGQGCYPADGGTTQCLTPTAAGAAEGATCMYTNDCVAGTACFNLTSGGSSRAVCLRLCDIGDGATDCPRSGGMACQAGGDLPTGTGVCPPPS